MTDAQPDGVTIVDRVNFARAQYLHTTGKIPTRLILTPNDMIELSIWLLRNKDEPSFITLPYTNEPQLCGMQFVVENFAKELRVYFQES